MAEKPKISLGVVHGARVLDDDPESEVTRKRIKSSVAMLVEERKRRGKSSQGSWLDDVAKALEEADDDDPTTTTTKPPTTGELTLIRDCPEDSGFACTKQVIQKP